MITRRAVLLAAGGGALLSACGSESEKPPSGALSARPGDIALVSSDVRRASGPAAAVPDAVGALHALGAGLYARLARESDNLALSPYSVAVALAMTQNGARGRTLNEMTAVLGGVDPGRLNGGLNALTAHVESLAGAKKKLDGKKGEIALRAANTLFGERTTTFEKGFLDTLAREYGAGLQAVDFKGDFEGARLAINDWVEARTEGRIEDLVPEGVLNTLTRLVLVNALYLKAPWEQPFEKDLTTEAPFHLLDGSTVSVPTMHLESRWGMLLGSGDGWQALRMPYAGRELAMTIVLPDEGRLADVEAELAAGGLATMLDSVRPAEVALSLPRWTFRTEAPLNEALIALGMPTAFEPVADFSGMSAEEKLFIRAVLHQTFIAVDEEGTEAAAATAVVMERVSAPQFLPFIADRPFLFVIHDVQHSTPLFLGRVADPSA